MKLLPTAVLWLQCDIQQKFSIPSALRHTSRRSSGEILGMSSDPVLAVGRAEVDDAETVPAGELLEDFARNVATATLLPPEPSSYSLFRYGNMFIQSLAERLSLVNVGQNAISIEIQVLSLMSKETCTRVKTLLRSRTSGKCLRF